MSSMRWPGCARPPVRQDDPQLPWRPASPVQLRRRQRRRWTSRNPVDDIELPRAPTYSQIRYLTTEEVWTLVEAVRPVPIAGTDATYEALDRAMIVTAAMTGLRIGELQALDWRSVDFVHARVRVRRTWDRKDKTFTTPKSRRSERAVPMPDEVAGHLERLLRTYHPDAVEPPPDSLVFAHPSLATRSVTRLMYDRLRAALKKAGLDDRSHGTTCATAMAPRSPRRAWRSARCRSGWATTTSRRRSATPTTAPTPASATSSRPRSPGAQRKPLKGHHFAPLPYRTESN